MLASDERRRRYVIVENEGSHFGNTAITLMRRGR